MLVLISGILLLGGIRRDSSAGASSYQREITRAGSSLKQLAGLLGVGTDLGN